MDKETGAAHPVIQSIHLAIQKIPGIPKWSRSTTIFAYLGKGGKFQIDQEIKRERKKNDWT